VEEHQAAEQLTNGALHIAYLIAAFPQCFFLNDNQRRPLKIDIDKGLLPLVSCSEEELKSVLNKYVRSDGYLLACKEDATRIDVNGDAASTVSAKHAAHARKVLADRALWRAKKKAAREREAETRRNTVAKRRQQDLAATDNRLSQELRTEVQQQFVPAQPPALAVTQRRQGRIGFAELRASAAQRKTAAIR
jgi:ProP effector